MSHDDICRARSARAMASWERRGRQNQHNLCTRQLLHGTVPRESTVLLVYVQPTDQLAGSYSVLLTCLVMGTGALRRLWRWFKSESLKACREESEWVSDRCMKNIATRKKLVERLKVKGGRGDPTHYMRVWREFFEGESDLALHGLGSEVACLHVSFE